MNRLRAITAIVLIPLVLFAVSRAAHPAWSQTSAVNVQSSSQLQLPDSAFPSDYTSTDSRAVAAADADNTDFTLFHTSSYSTLGTRGGWLQVGDAGTFREDNPFPLVPVAYISIGLGYLGTYYADEVAARNAFTDITSKPQKIIWELCTQGEQCLQGSYAIDFLGVQTLYGRIRVIQVGNVLVEIHSDVLTDNFSLDPATNSKTLSNIDAVTQGVVQVLATVSPTSTPANTPTPLPTATFTPTPIPTNTPTPTSTPTDTPTPLPGKLHVGVRPALHAGHSSTVRVTVTNAGNQSAVEDALVTLDARKLGVSRVRHAHTNADGVASFKGILPQHTGSFKISAEKNGFDSQTTTVHVHA